MKKIKLAVVIFSLFELTTTNESYGFSAIRSINSDPYQILLNLTAAQFTKLSAKQFTVLTGKKLNFFQKISFELTKLKVKHDLKKKLDVRLLDYLKEDAKFKFDAGWFFLGMIGPFGLGVLLAYLTKQEKYKVTSAWIGFAFVYGLLLIILLTHY